ncbi:MAG: sterol desaturase family protein [Proteobacteria bacterium]|nr:sterol desaturase family protein [Pseudomonadota bacterium]
MFNPLETTPEWKEALDAWEGIPDSPPKVYRKRAKGFQVLQNDFMEKWFGTSHWAMPGVWFIPVITACVWHALTVKEVPALTVLGLFTLGALAWTLVEYILHRFLFHLPPAKNKFLKELQYVMHGYHHDFPDDPGRLVAPPALSWPLATLLVFAYMAAFNTWWSALFAGTVAGYLGYDWMHYYTHHAKPKNRFGRFMRRFHFEHHFGTAYSQFGLSSPLWDLVFQTFWTTGALGKKKSKDKRSA